MKTLILHAKNNKPFYRDVSGYVHASRISYDFIKNNNLGSSDLCEDHGLIVENKKIIANVSYNGKVWNDKYLIYNPYEI